jgi:hypothetical protein
MAQFMTNSSHDFRKLCSESINMLVQELPAVLSSKAKGTKFDLGICFPRMIEQSMDSTVTFGLSPLTNSQDVFKVCF